MQRSRVMGPHLAPALTRPELPSGASGQAKHQLAGDTTIAVPQTRLTKHPPASPNTLTRRDSAGKLSWAATETSLGLDTEHVQQSPKMEGKLGCERENIQTVTKHRLQ